MVVFRNYKEVKRESEVMTIFFPSEIGSTLAPETGHVVDLFQWTSWVVCFSSCRRDPPSPIYR